MTSGLLLRQRFILSFLSFFLVLSGASIVFAQTTKKVSAKPAKAQVSVPKSESKPDSKLAPKSTPTIMAIEIKGQRKIEKDAISARLKSKVGSPYFAAQIREDLQSIFKSGFFYDVIADKENVAGGVKLTFTVVEKPSVVEILFEGNNELKEDELKEASTLKAYEILNSNKLRDAVTKIQKLYEEKGFFLAKIDLKIEDIKKDESVKVIFSIEENDKVKVKKLTFLGNNRLKDGFLKSRLQTNEGGYFSFLSGSGSYKQDVFDIDMQRLKYIYFNEGFVQVKIDRPQVYVTPDKKSIYVTIRVDEGEQYNVGEIDYAGDILFPREELNELIEINKREVFSYEVLQKDLSELQAKYGDLGYAFANVIPRTRVNDQERKVDITFEFDKGSKVYFGQINVVGNSKTRDKVIRRELRVREGELYNETRKRKSLENVQRLGFFDEVVFKTSTPPETPDVLNIDITVKERNTGSIQLGAGYGSATGFNLQGQINQSNFLGKGQKLGASLSLSKDQSNYSFSFTEPNVKDTEWSLGFEVYQNLTGRTEYNEKKIGGAVRIGHPLGENISGSLRYKLDNTELLRLYDSTKTPAKVVTPVDVFPIPDGGLEKVTSSVTGLLEYDDRNDRFSPTKGSYAATSLEYAGIGGDLRYTKANVTYRYFKKLFWEVVWRNNMSYSFITSHESGVEPPFNELYLLGGPYSLRGYRFFRVGKTKYSNQIATDPDVSLSCQASARCIAQAANRPYGGTKQFVYQMEFEFPLIAEAGIKGVAFYDVGQAEDEITADNFYSDVGFGFRWFSPIGPLRFEWGFPLRKTEASPDPVVFDFSIGAPF